MKAKWYAGVLLLGALFLAQTAAAQTVGIVNLRVSNNFEDWGGFQQPFNTNAEVAIFVDLATGQHGGFYYSGTCVLALSATGQELYRLAIPSVWLENGSDQVRSQSFLMSWPQAAVTVTCVPDYNPTQAISVSLPATLFWNGPIVTNPVYTPPPVMDGTVACQDRMLALGWAPASLSYCTGVNANCALTLLDRGWDPSNLPYCVAVEETCSLALLNAGWAPQGLSNCIAVEPTCASELLSRGWDPSGLTYCIGVNAQCARGVLQQGFAPSELTNCYF
jgi:hypothetical protein